MPIDPSIPLRAQAPAIDSPMQTLAQIYQLQNMRQGQELNQLQIQRERGLAEEDLIDRQKKALDATDLAAVRNTIPQITKFNKAELYAKLTPSQQLQADEYLAAWEENLAKTRKAKSDADKAAEEAKRLTFERRAGLARAVEQAGSDPEILRQAFSLEAEADPDILPYWEQVKANPENIPTFLKAIQTMHKAPEGYTLSRGDIRVEDGEVVAEGNPVAETYTLTDYMKDAADEQRRSVRSFSLEEKEGLARRFAALNDQPQRAIVPIVIQTPTGPQLVNREEGTATPVRAAGTGADIGPMPTADERNMGLNYKRAQPVLKMVSDLSEKIFTEQGVYAKLSGSVERAKARVNLNDNVASYEALTEGAIPILARALGHSGVLTELDVQKTLRLLPKVGESKSLRDQKIAIITALMEDIQDAVASGRTARTYFGGTMAPNGKYTPGPEMGAPGQTPPAGGATAAPGKTDADRDWEIFQGGGR